MASCGAKGICNADDRGGGEVVLVLFRVGSFGSALHNFWR